MVYYMGGLAVGVFGEVPKIDVEWLEQCSS